jgi:hypothetical protein
MRTRAVVGVVGLALTLTACGTAVAQTESRPPRHVQTIWACAQKSGSQQITRIGTVRHGCGRGSYKISWSGIEYAPAPEPTKTVTVSPTP